MSPQPLPFVWHEADKAFRPLKRAENAASAAYGDGEVVLLAPVEERSEVSHRHEFAFIREAWLNLPETLQGEYPTSEHLRKKGLIATGWSTVQDYVCGTKAEALRWSSNLRAVLATSDPYALVIVNEGVVRVYRARSQKRGAMNKSEWQASKTALLEWVADLIGTDPTSLERRVAA